jgi:hypothetical protein
MFSEIAKPERPDDAGGGTGVRLVAPGKQSQMTALLKSDAGAQASRHAIHKNVCHAKYGELPYKPSEESDHAIRA